MPVCALFEVFPHGYWPSCHFPPRSPLPALLTFPSASRICPRFDNAPKPQQLAVFAFRPVIFFAFSQRHLAVVPARFALFPSYTIIASFLFRVFSALCLLACFVIEPPPDNLSSHRVWLLCSPTTSGITTHILFFILFVYCCARGTADNRHTQDHTPLPGIIWESPCGSYDT